MITCFNITINKNKLRRDKIGLKIFAVVITSPGKPSFGMTPTIKL